MLEHYYPANMGAEPVTDEQHKRLVAVQAALELIRLRCQTPTMAMAWISS